MIALFYRSVSKNSMIQQGSQGATQTLQVNEDLDGADLPALIEALRVAVAELPGDEDLRSEAEVQFQTLEVQSRSKSPPPAVVGGALRALAGLFKTVPSYVFGAEAVKQIDLFLVAHHLLAR